MKKLHSDRYKSGEKALTRAEYDRLISVITDVEDELLIKWAVAIGLRREDLCSIETERIDLAEKSLEFHEHKKDRRDKHTGEMKERWRRIDLSPGCIVVLEKFWNTLDKNERKRKYLFSFCGRTAYRHLNHWCRVAGIAERPFHALRATCIKFAHTSGWSDEQISKLTGDKIATIQEHYLTPSVDEMRTVTSEKEII